MSTDAIAIDNKAADRIRALMTRLNMNQAQAAAYLGVPQGTIGNWLGGTRQPNQAVNRLLDVLQTIEILAPGIHAHLMPEKGGAR